MSAKSRTFPLHEWMPRIDVDEPALWPEDAPPPSLAADRGADAPSVGVVASPTVLLAGVDGAARAGAEIVAGHLEELVGPFGLSGNRAGCERRCQQRPKRFAHVRLPLPVYRPSRPAPSIKARGELDFFRARPP